MAKKDDLEKLGYERTTRTEKEQERILQLGSLCRVFEQGDRVLSGDPIKVDVVDSGPANAWSDGETIYINESVVKDLDEETLLNVSSLNYHELAHHFFNPRKSTELVKWVLKNDYTMSMNILEDQRIETLIVARYPSLAPYLVNNTAQWLENSPENIMGMYPLVRGRRYLPVDIREAYRDAFDFPELIPVIAEIVDEYRLLSFPNDYKKAQELIKRFQDEVIQPMESQFPDMAGGGPNECGSRDPMVKGRPEPGKNQDADSQRAEGMGEEESPFNGTPVDGDGDGEPIEGLGNKPAQPKSGEEAAKNRDESAKKTPKGLKPGKGHVDSVGGVPANIKSLWKDAVSDVYSNKNVQKDIRSKQRVIVGGDGKYDDPAKHGRFDTVDVPLEVIQEARRFSKELERLRDECEPAWNKGVPAGRLNVQRWINGCEIDEAFDRWEEGNDGADVEAVILIDRSGSMTSDSNDRNASLACWTIKRALEAIDAPVTVYAFDDKAEVAYTSSERANKTKFKFIFGSGGTDPYSSLVMAEQLLMSSRKKNKMMFIITDGFFNNEKNDEIIERISKRGILTSVVLIMDSRTYAAYPPRHPEQYRHKAEIFGRIGSARDLTVFAKEIVTGAIKKNSRR